MAVANEDLNTITQSAEPAPSEPTPPIEAPSVPETIMEVTPELRQQEAPMAHMAGEAAAPMDAPHPAHDQGVPADMPEQSGAEHEARHGVVVPLARTPMKPDVVTGPFTPSEDAALMHTLRVAAARGASTVYVVAQSKPMIRIDGEIGPLESEPTLTAADVERLVLELAPPRRRDALQNGPVEWLCDVPDVGRVRCLTFRDHRGPGVLFRMMPPRAISVDQLGLTPEVQALCQQSDGLVLVAGARSSGKSTLLNSFIDVINRTRSDHLITVESQIGFVHESRRSFISQRETRGDGDLAATYARAALREDPDVMVIEDLKSAELVTAALEAAESGRLVLASVPAASTIGALERLIEVLPADRRTKARSSLATALRGVIAQVLLRRVTGGRAVAREILLNTPAVSQIVLEGKMFQLPVALDSGRRHGMIPLTDSLAAHVRAGTVDVAEAYRKALDRSALVALLKREGFDTSFAERLA
jgi:twitching motility protein PilT